MVGHDMFVLGDDMFPLGNYMFLFGHGWFLFGPPKHIQSKLEFVVEYLKSLGKPLRYTTHTQPEKVQCSSG
jgi:hypothetical protein